jgi:hypothetical protein
MERNSKGQFIKGLRGVNQNTYDGFGIWYETKGYPAIWIDGKAIKLHIYIWEKHNGEKPKGHDIHHKDFDKGNYNLANLELLTKSDHAKLHAGWIRQENKWTHKPCTGCGEIFPLSDFYIRKGYTPSAKCKRCHCKDTRKWAIKNPDKKREIGRNWARRKYMKERLNNA